MNKAVGYWLEKCLALNPAWRIGQALTQGSYAVGWYDVFYTPDEALAQGLEEVARESAVVAGRCVLCGKAIGLEEREAWKFDGECADCGPLLVEG